jgi:hypothetical protein
MNEQHPHDVEASLRRRAAQLEYPPTPDIARAVRQRIDDNKREHRQRILLPRMLMIIALAVLLILPFAAPLRAAVERLWRVGAVELVVETPVPFAPTALPITPVPAAPTVSATPTSRPSSTQAPLAGQTTLAEAQDRVPFEILLPAYPADLGPPNQVFVQDIDGPTLIMTWVEPGSQHVFLSLQVFSSDIVARKLLFADDQAQRTTVNGDPAIWIDVPHVFKYVVPQGEPGLQEGRLVQGNVLIWTGDTLTYRLESSLSLAEARRVAESLR